MSSPPKPSKIEDVARQANVSIMSVSRALRGVEGVSEKKRAEILKIARRMKYIPNSAARSLAEANSNLIGISLPTFAADTFAEILNGMRQTFNTAGYSSVIDTTEYSSEAELNWIKRLLLWQPAAIILTSTDHHPETRELLNASPIPVLEIWDYTEDPIDICVGIDHLMAGRLIGEHAVSLGYQRPAFVSTPQGYDKLADARLEGIRHVFSQQRATHVIAERPPLGNPFATGFSATKALLAQHAPDIICYLDDNMAFGGLMCCQAEGLSVPGDIGIIGFNALDLGSVLPIKLTTVRTLRRLMGIIGARNLLSRINGVPTQKSKILPLELQPGQTTRPQTDNDRLKKLSDPIPITLHQ